MDEWVQRAIAKWPNVPALFGWLGLTRRGHWLIQGERITHPRIVDAISRNYDRDAHGRWFFQNGPQRGYIALEYTPRVARVQADDRLAVHTGAMIDTARALYLDENSAAVLDCADGATLIDNADLAWVLERLRFKAEPVEEAALAEALAMASGERTALTLDAFDTQLPVYRCDADVLPERLDFVRDPRPCDHDPGHQSAHSDA